ncbi:LOW QUALITY PROTEIN: ubiquitin-like protein ISG15 [Pelodiscus sinensis]|uniref:LOW QUALITY PROTEIN: ubiquitin-like protein ISG15 n=1 Tax=Pelodiscus sinensis TaxID=13735 RepID=UPI003F6A9EEA
MPPALSRAAPVFREVVHIDRALVHSTKFIPHTDGDNVGPALSLRVTLLTGETHTVAASGATPLAAFKAQLARQTGVPAAQQRLACPDGVELRDGSRLADYPLAPGDTVLLMVRREEPCPVFVKNPKGRTSTYSVLPSEGVASFRARVQQQERIDAGQFWLSLAGKPLEDGHTLGDYGVAPHCTIFLHLRLRGGRTPRNGPASLPPSSGLISTS